MKLFIKKNKTQGDKKAFEIIKKQVLLKPSSLIGLATGKTTDRLHKLISKDVIKNPQRWSKLKIFQIDENLYAPPSSTLSFNNELRKELKSLIKILNPKNIFLIDGTENPKKTINKAYRFLKKNKGIDLIILGIGPEYDPHIAYNTCGKSSLKSKMRVVALHKKISKKVKTKKGITIGLHDILKAKKVLLIAYGKEKTKSLKLALKEKINVKRCSASALQLHKNVAVVIDRSAIQD